MLMQLLKNINYKLLYNKCQTIRNSFDCFNSDKALKMKTFIKVGTSLYFSSERLALPLVTKNFNCLLAIESCKLVQSKAIALFQDNLSNFALWVCSSIIFRLL